MTEKIEYKKKMFTRNKSKKKRKQRIRRGDRMHKMRA